MAKSNRGRAPRDRKRPYGFPRPPCTPKPPGPPPPVRPADPGCSTWPDAQELARKVLRKKGRKK